MAAPLQQLGSSESLRIQFHGFISTSPQQHGSMMEKHGLRKVPQESVCGPLLSLPRRGTHDLKRRAFNYSLEVRLMECVRDRRVGVSFIFAFLYAVAAEVVWNAASSARVRPGGR